MLLLQVYFNKFFDCTEIETQLNSVCQSLQKGNLIPKHFKLITEIEYSTQKGKELQIQLQRTFSVSLSSTKHHLIKIKPSPSIRYGNRYKCHWAMLLFLMFDCIATSIRLFPKKKSVATMLVSFHHSSWNLKVRFLFTESAIRRSPPDRLKIISNGFGVSSAITAHNGFWLFLNIFGPMRTSSRYLKRPSTVCWFPHAWDIVGQSQSYSKKK